MFLGNRNITTVKKLRARADPESFPEGGGPREIYLARVSKAHFFGYALCIYFFVQGWEFQIKLILMETPLRKEVVFHDFFFGGGDKGGWGLGGGGWGE